jgi:general secretion pathway protein I
LKTACSHRKRFTGSDGFTLLEVMISVSIIAIIFVSLFRMQSGSISLAETGRFNILAPILAERILIKIETDILNWSEVEGNFGETYPGFGWTCEIVDFPIHELDFMGKDSNHKLKKIIVTITGSSSRQTPFKTETWRVVFD